MNLKQQALAEGAKKHRSFYCSIPVSGYLPGGINDWPSHIVEPLLECMERIEAKNRIKLKVVAAACRMNPEGFSVVVEAIEDRTEGVRVNGLLVPWSDLSA